MSYALRHAPATTLAPLHYLEIISAVFFGFAVFGDFPDVLTWVGIGVISLSGIYVILRERQVARQPRLAAAPFPPEL
jgi:drug/metabolite transporter (DMT)-like permease